MRKRKSDSSTSHPPPESGPRSRDSLKTRSRGSGEARNNSKPYAMQPSGARPSGNLDLLLEARPARGRKNVKTLAEVCNAWDDIGAYRAQPGQQAPMMSRLLRRSSRLSRFPVGNESPGTCRVTLTIGAITGHFRSPLRPAGTRLR